MSPNEPTLDDILFIISDRLKIDRDELHANSCAADFPEMWDSVGTIDLLLALDENFDIRVEPGSADNLTSVGGIVSLVKACRAS